VKKHDVNKTVDPAVRSALMERVVGGALPCAVAFDLAARNDWPPAEIGRAADILELRLTKCQLGLFGYQPKKSIVRPWTTVPAELEAAIRNGLVEGRLPCAKAWDIAEALGIHKMRVSAACDGLAIKIRPCQLGAF